MDDSRTPAKTSITSINPHTYRASLPLDQCHGNIAHGGFLASLIYKVAQLHFRTTLRTRDQPHTFTLNIFFLRAVTVGDVQFKVQDTKLGSDISTIHVALVQGGKEKVAAYASNTNMQIDKGITLDLGYEISPKPAMPDLAKLSHHGHDARWVGFTFPGHPQSLLKASSHVKLFVPIAGPPRRDITDIWLSPSSPHATFTTESLGFVADSWHRVPENNLPYPTWDNASMVSAARQRAEGRLADTEIGSELSTYWYLTLNLSLEIKKLLPRGGVRWLFVRAQVREVRNGRMGAEVMIFDQDGGLVALSHQICHAVENTEALKKKQRLSKGKL